MIGTSKYEKFADSDYKIYVIKLGWVLIGREVKQKPKLWLRVLCWGLGRRSSTIKIHNSAVVRIWGTEAGLGELAINGPIKGKTQLDANGISEVERVNCLFTIQCDPVIWAKELE